MYVALFVWATCRRKKNGKRGETKEDDRYIYFEPASERKRKMGKREETRRMAGLHTLGPRAAFIVGAAAVVPHASGPTNPNATACAFICFFRNWAAALSSSCKQKKKKNRAKKSKYN